MGGGQEILNLGLYNWKGFTTNYNTEPYGRRRSKEKRSSSGFGILTLRYSLDILAGY